MATTTPHDLHAFALLNAIIYVLSGCSQPLIMTIATDAGLADPVAQVYMFFYYLGPSLMVIPLLRNKEEWPSTSSTLKCIGIALFDIASTSMNYTGASLAGPTIFAIVYSSVTVWTALFSQICLGRKLNGRQWMGVCAVFGGLTLTAVDSLQLGEDVVKGLLLVLFGSVMHAMTYILCEAIMTIGEEKLSVLQSCAIQAGTACIFFLVWQIIYSLPRREEVLLLPMQEAGTTMRLAIGILSAFAFVNLAHSIAFYETLLHYPGGSTSAGVFKGLQAVLVFVLTHVAFCGRTGGEEMCFTTAKFLSLVTVVGGVVGYGVATHNNPENHSGSKKSGYEIIEDVASIEVEPLSPPR